jgi:acetamidase/formamidase
MFRISRDRLSYFVGPEIDPVMEVPDGATVVFETVDCFSGNVRRPEDKFSSYAESLEVLEGWNPITGPVFVKGARPGDFLGIDILDIKLPDKGVTSLVPKIGMLSSPYQLGDDLEPDTRVCRISDDHVYLPTSRGEIKIPASPLIGTISVAPSRERIASFKFGAEHCGNVDCNEVAKGNRMILPVNTEGALFGLGDVHAVQGDGEITCVAIEIPAEVTVKINLIPREEGQFIGCPQINGDEFVGSIGCHFGNAISENIKYACFDVVQRLKEYYGFTIMDAYHLFSQVGEVRVCQVLGDFQAAMAKVNKRFIE